MAATHNVDPGDNARRILHAHLGGYALEPDDSEPPDFRPAVNWERYENEPAYRFYCDKYGYPPE